MTEEERREMMRSNWTAQMASMGYGPEGMALPPSGTKTENLKPCPFCGGRARYVDLGVQDEFHDWDVECTKCGVVMICPAKEEGCTTTKKGSQGRLEQEDGMSKTEPRAMTADEVKGLQSLCVVCWLWLEEAQRVTWNVHHIRAFVYSKHPDNGEFYIMANCYHEIIKLEGNDYGKTWRIWTECPSYEQREATSWN